MDELALERILQGLLDDKSLLKLLRNVEKTQVPKEKMKLPSYGSKNSYLLSFPIDHRKAIQEN